MIFHNLLTEGESDTRAAKFILAVEALENVEDLIGVRLFKPDAIVLEADLSKAAYFLITDNDTRGLAGKFQSIADEVAEELSELGSHASNHW